MRTRRRKQRRKSKHFDFKLRELKDNLVFTNVEIVKFKFRKH